MRLKYSVLANLYLRFNKKKYIETDGLPKLKPVN